MIFTLILIVPVCPGLSVHTVHVSICCPAIVVCDGAGSVGVVEITPTYVTFIGRVSDTTTPVAIPCH